MDKKYTAFLAVIFSSMCSVVAILEAQKMDAHQALSPIHLGAAMNTGLTEAQMKDFIAVLKSKVGTKEAESADAI